MHPHSIPFMIGERPNARSVGFDLDGVVFKPGSGDLIEGVIETVRQAVDQRGFLNVWIVSRCDKRQRPRSLARLERVDFYERTGLMHDHVIFVDTLAQKAEACRQLGIRDFVDDSPEALIAMKASVDGLFFFKTPGRGEQLFRQFMHALSGVMIIHRPEQLVPYLVTSD